jgi:Predicted membrane protein (DUF2085)
MMNMHSQVMRSLRRSGGSPALSWPRWPLLAALWVLFLGPPAAALFIASGLPIAADTGWLARDLLSVYICPTPMRSYMLLDAPMAVCARCWGATIGLWAAYLLVARRWPSVGAPSLIRVDGWARYYGLPWAVRLIVSALPFGLWVVEIALWPNAPLSALLLNGILSGGAAGLFVYSIWPGLLRT